MTTALAPTSKQSLLDSENSETISQLHLEITLTGTEYNGELNLGTVEADLNGKLFYIDILSSIGNADHDSGNYTLKSFFETDISVLSEVISPEHHTGLDYEQSLADLLANSETKLSTELITDEDNDIINRVIGVKLKQLNSDLELDVSF